VVERSVLHRRDGSTAGKFAASRLDKLNRSNDPSVHWGTMTAVEKVTAAASGAV
jgi:hypothetical protein